MPGYSCFVNLLDYTSSVIPVTTADKTLDPVDSGYVPLSELDKKIQETCEYCSFFTNRRSADYP